MSAGPGPSHKDKEYMKLTRAYQHVPMKELVEVLDASEELAKAFHRYEVAAENAFAVRRSTSGSQALRNLRTEAHEQPMAKAAAQILAELVLRAALSGGDYLAVLHHEVKRRPKLFSSVETETVLCVADRWTDELKR